MELWRTVFVIIALEAYESCILVKSFASIISTSIAITFAMTLSTSNCRLFEMT